MQPSTVRNAAGRRPTPSGDGGRAAHEDVKTRQDRGWRSACGLNTPLDGKDGAQWQD